MFRNIVNIEMIPDELYKQIFFNVPRQKQISSQLIQRVQRHLDAHLQWRKEVPGNFSPLLQNFKIPKLEGSSIESHFRNIASHQTFSYKKLLNELTTEKLPKKPKLWAMENGWTMYLENGEIRSVPYPQEDAYVFDIEVCLSNGLVPTMACAVSNQAWYSWCSQDLMRGVNREQSKIITLQDLIPFETLPDQNTESEFPDFKEKIIVGHNVGYDRARIKEQYFLQETKLRFLDTMSLHIAISGITSFQRALKMSMKKGLEGVNQKSRQDLMIAGNMEWNDLSSLNNLLDVHKLYCSNTTELDKETRNLFVEGDIPLIKKNFQSLMDYCSNDVKATHDILVNLLPTFYVRFPHPVTFAGMLEMGQGYLPINSNWNKYIKCAEETYNHLENEIKSILIQKADEALLLLKDEKYKQDPWLWDLDWTLPKTRRNSKTNPLNQNNVKITNESQPIPAWYKKLLCKESIRSGHPTPSNISTSMRIVPKLLKLCWYGLPLHFVREGGWGYLIRNNFDDSEVENEELNFIEEDKENAQFPYKEWRKIWDNNFSIVSDHIQKCDPSSSLKVLEGETRTKSEEIVQEVEDFWKGLKSATAIGLRTKQRGNPKFSKQMKEMPSPHPFVKFCPLPHKEGKGAKVGNPLSKDFLSKIQDGTITSVTKDDIANKVIKLRKAVSYWKNNRDRILEQLTVWVNLTDENKTDVLGAILPQVAVAGTLTRRGVEKTWMTASNAYKDRIGSELKSMVQAPPGYNFVGADVDSQELWIASLIGDAHFGGFHGSTALGWMTLQGTKANSTDMHSKTANLVGIHRDQAKILNYGRIYGAGVNYAERLLQQFNSRLSAAEAKKRANSMYSQTKGKRKYMLNEKGVDTVRWMENSQYNPDELLSKEDLQKIMYQIECPPIDMMDLVAKVVWDGGSESAMFNRLEEIAQMECPQTPILDACISRSLVPSVVQQDFMTSRVNWVVQSSAVDYLHLMLTSMRWLFHKFKIQGRFCISVHDEVRYLVKSEDKYKAALALQITNLLTRSFCSSRLGIYDLPQTVAFFSTVDIDKVLRKEVNDDCLTPSNAKGLRETYQIPFGEALTIQSLLQKMNSSHGL